MEDDVSYVSVYAVRQSGDVECIGEARNNHGFAPLVWDYLGEKCGIDVGGFGSTRDANLERLWKLFKPGGGGALDEPDNVLLGATFDRVWLKRERLPLLFDAVRRFTEEYVRPRGRVETAAECVRLIEEELVRDSALAGVCFNMCSAVDSYWHKRVPIGEDGQPLVGNGEPADYDYVTLNVFKDVDNGCGEGKHWEIGEV